MNSRNSRKSQSNSTFGVIHFFIWLAIMLAIFAH